MSSSAELPHSDPVSEDDRVRDLEQALLRERRLLAAEQQRVREVGRKADGRPTKRELRDAQADMALMQKRLDDVYSSRTWRVGRIIWNVFHLPRTIWTRLRRSETHNEPDSTQPPSDANPDPKPVAYSLVEDTVVREKYQRALNKRGFAATGTGRNLVMAVYTIDLDCGRGDLYTAVGLGRYLETIGFDVVYVPMDQWYEPPPQTDIYLALLETVDLRLLPREIKTIAWIRNQTEAWIRQPWLTWYDQIFCSSGPSRDAISEVYPGPLSVLPIGVDPELFHQSGRAEDRAGVVSTVNQWGRERELFVKLEAGGPIDFPLALFGERRGMPPALSPYGRGPISFFALPGLYNESKVVLDDFNHTTEGYGNVNSRVFEAAACGAALVTNRARGLDELGLADIPAYGSSAELRDLVGSQLNSLDARKQAEDRSRIVLERHSYAVRADEFRRATTGAAGGTSEQMIIGVYPPYTDNPYVEMMWSAVRDDGGMAMMLDDDRDFDVFLAAATNRPALLHLNWTAPILGYGKDAAGRLERYRWFLARVDEVRDLGVPVVWTVHNVLPHECADPRLEAQLRQGIVDRADIVHVMCESTAASCAGIFTIPSEKLRTIPHPSYVDVYPNLIDRQTARFELGLDYDDTVYLYFGQVRPYKGVDVLLDAFDRLSRTSPKAKLIVVGKAGRFPEITEIKQRARAHPQILSVFNEVPDSDVQIYMNAANVVVLPYRNALNSGALQLAYSFARPVVAPAVGCIGDQVDGTTGISFDPNGGSTALLAAMQDAEMLGTEHEAAAYARAGEGHYRDVGRDFANLARRVMAQRSVETSL